MTHSRLCTVTMVDIKFDKILGMLREKDSSTFDGIISKLQINATCAANTVLGDAVYVFTDGTLRKANASSINTAKVIGFIDTKQSSTSCTITLSGVITVISGLTPGKAYFLSDVAGGIQDFPPIGSGNVVTQVGIALSSSQLLVGLSNVYNKRA